MVPQSRSSVDELFRRPVSDIVLLIDVILLLSTDADVLVVLNWLLAALLGNAGRSLSSYPYHPRSSFIADSAYS